jgi:hypothetical protein
MAARPIAQIFSRRIDHRATREWWNTRWFVAAALFLSVLPLLWPAIPPLIDLPSHMGVYHVALNLDSSPTLQRWFEFRWEIIGNLGVELLVMPLGKLLGVELATKLVVILIPLLSVLGMIWIAWEIHGELPPSLGFALPLAYCYPLHFGFVNYCLSVALMLLGFALWIRLGRQDRLVWRAAIFAVLAIVVWLAHAIGWGLLVIACGFAEVHRRIERGEDWARALPRSIATCASLCTPVLIMAWLPHLKPSSTDGWFMPFELAKWLGTLFRDRWIAFDLGTAAVFMAVLVAAVLGRAGMRLRPALALPALALFATFVVAPESINESGFVNGRIAPYALALLAIAIGMRQASEHQRRAVALAAGVFLVVRLAATSASLALYSVSYAANLKALDQIRPGDTVIAFSPVPCAHGLANWWTPRVYHLPSLALIRKDAFVNTEWQIDGLQLLRVKYAAAKPFDSDPSQTVTLGCEVPRFRQYRTSIDSFPRPAFDYLWLLEIPRSMWPAEPDLQLVWFAGDSALYRIVHAPGQPAH